MKKSLVFFFFTVVTYVSHAQSGFSISIDYETPLDGLGIVYKPTTGYTLHYLSHDDLTIWNWSIGYQLFKPKQDTFYYAFSENNHGTVTYEDYTIIPMYGGVTRKIDLFNNVKLLPGIDIGYYCIINDGLTFKGDLSPKLGLSYNFTESFSIRFQSKYNVFFEVGSSDPQSVHYNPHLGTFDLTFSNGISLSYVFN